ncbi:hypothetical protein OUZ56_002931 [Daphnia magna]|uniref:Uncharacterized protein n=1 Tax=Daphnia magna TaxID=35525 RepID=A0ABR0A775_9CRUS|nr:hypothetical protein OUZ56_002931 [Daphnia magna]
MPSCTTRIDQFLPFELIAVELRRHPIGEQRRRALRLTRRKEPLRGTVSCGSLLLRGVGIFGLGSLASESDEGVFFSTENEKSPSAIYVLSKVFKRTQSISTRIKDYRCQKSSLTADVLMLKNRWNNEYI